MTRCATPSLVDEEIQALDAALDAFEDSEFIRSVTEAADLGCAVSVVTGSPPWLNAKARLSAEQSLSPVVLDRLKRYALTKAQPNTDHPSDASALANLLLLSSIYGRESPEFRASIALAKCLSNPWWSWQWILSVNA